jgi:hypothetical protein
MRTYVQVKKDSFMLVFMRKYGRLCASLTARRREGFMVAAVEPQVAPTVVEMKDLQGRQGVEIEIIESPAPRAEDGEGMAAFRRSTTQDEVAAVAAKGLGRSDFVHRVDSVLAAEEATAARVRPPYLASCR